MSMEMEVNRVDINFDGDGSAYDTLLQVLGFMFRIILLDDLGNSPPVIQTCVPIRVLQGAVQKKNSPIFADSLSEIFHATFQDKLGIHSK